MKKIIANELKKVSATKIEFDENTTSIFIPKTLKILNTSVKQGEVYRIRLEEFITNPYQSSTLASNWNNGVIPKHSEYIAEIVTKMANMIKINGVATDDYTDNFCGWLPIEGFEIINKEQFTNMIKFVIIYKRYKYEILRTG